MHTGVCPEWQYVSCTQRAPRNAYDSSPQAGGAALSPLGPGLHSSQQSPASCLREGAVGPTAMCQREGGRDR